jgi:hypothetical protein
VLKFIFWSLLCLNALLFAYSQGLLGNFQGNEREPARMKSQQSADKLVLVSAAHAALAVAPPAEPKPEVKPDAPVAATACFEVGNLAAAEARRFETRVATLDLGERQTRTASPAIEATSHIVFIPPQGSKEGAERKAAELKGFGVTDYFIISDSSAMKWGISLGVFKSEAAAQGLLASLVKQGVHSARLTARGGQPAKVAFQFRAIDALTKTKIDDIAGSFAAAETNDCK